MSFGIRIRVFGDFACFTRPEMKVERVSYDVMTPSAARGILEAIYWKPSILWVIDRIHVLKPIRFTNLRRNEVSEKIPPNTVTQVMNRGQGRLELVAEEHRQQRASLLLVDVDYVIEAHFEIRDPNDANTEKHRETFQRRVRKGQTFHHPYLGCREFPAKFEEVGEIPVSPLSGSRDLGFMLHDLDFAHDLQPRFFRAELQDGILHVPAFNSEEVVS
ncbi:MAG TPA: type I-C CRISPR-associated protein Cas5c [Kiritimatiellia bacterium]|nr:type I-C CRISPR-associated protein Cas5c [Kiritimatiellia bacterium]